MKRWTLFFCLAAAAPAAELEFYRDIQPFLKANCISCHNLSTSKAGLNMETPELMIKGGDSGPALVPGKGAESLVVLASRHQQDMEMPPPNNKSGAVNLTEAQIALLKQWIDQGAKSEKQEERAVVLQSPLSSVNPIYCVAVSPDGRYAACGRSNRVFVHDLATRRLIADFEAHRSAVSALAFSPDGSRLASAGFREVKLWRLEPANAKAPSAPSRPAAREALQKIAAAGHAVLASAVSPDGAWNLTGGEDGSVRIWDAAGAKQIAELSGTLQSRQRAAELERTVAAQTLEQAFHKEQITRIETQDKALDVLLGKAKEAIVSMGKVLPEKQKAVPPAVAAREEADKAVQEVAAKLEALPQGGRDAQLEKDLKAAQDKLITARTAETSALAAVSAAESNIRDAEDEVKRITAAKAENAKLVKAANSAIAAAKSAQEQAAAELADLKKPASKPAAKPLAVAFSQDSQAAAAWFEDGALRVWAVATGQVIEETRAANSSVKLAAAADGSFVATQSVTLATRSAPRWVLERALNEAGLFADRVNALRFSPDGKLLAAGGGEPSRSGEVVLIDTAGGKVIRRLSDPHSDSVLCLDFSPDGKRLATGSADKIAKVFEVQSGKQVNLFEGHTHHVTGISFRADGRVLATAGADGTVVTWDMILGERKKKITGWTKEVTALQFIGATSQIATSAGDNRVRIVSDDGAEVRSIANLPDYMQSVAAAANGALLVAGGEDSILRVWDGTNGKELAVFDNN